MQVFDRKGRPQTGWTLSTGCWDFLFYRELFMEPIKIVVTDYIEPDLKWEEEELGKYGHVAFEYHQLKFREESELVEKIVDADMILVNMVKMTAGVIDQLERCKLILRHGVGYDNVDVSAATKKGIRVAYEPDYCSDEVAEHAITLMLSGWRKLNVGRKILEASSRNGIWDFTEVYPVYSVKGKTVGIIGCGRIGSLTLQKLAGFEVDILVCDPFLSEERQEELGVRTVDLDTVLKEADMITVHASLDEESYHLIGERELRAMKSHAYLVIRHAAVWSTRTPLRVPCGTAGSPARPSTCMNRSRPIRKWICSTWRMRSWRPIWRGIRKRRTGACAKR